jgi:hypothetical protein
LCEDLFEGGNFVNLVTKLIIITAFVVGAANTALFFSLKVHGTGIFGILLIYVTIVEILVIGFHTWSQLRKYQF